ncbi:MAG TPA: FHA domain-containing protein [Clostridia bacterium]|nr:FHA domain-containing protein [Clostridia bacterium]
MLACLTRLDKRSLWQLDYQESPGSQAIDASSETILLRHRPAGILPVSWHLDGDRLLFHPSVTGKKSLRLLVEDMEKKPGPGYRLLSQIMELVHLALDHYLIPQASLLTPDLIYGDQEAGQGLSLEILCLPLAEDPGLEAGEADLIDWLAENFHWEDPLAERLGQIYKEADYGGLLEEARTLDQVGRPGKEAPLEEPAPLKDRKEDKPAMARSKSRRLARLFASLASLGRQVLGKEEVHSFHEVTQEISHSSSQLPMARLSRGLPGTPEEEAGETAYILTESFVIGRDIREADLCLDSSAVSRLHARILLKGDRYYLEDLGSRNGSSLDGMPLSRHKAYLLPAKCRISFAGQAFYFQSA